MATRLLNDPLNAVDDMLDGVIYAHHTEVIRTAGGRGLAKIATPGRHRAVVVSGGGSGHEPAFWGLIGDGMLDAVAVGNVFAAPGARHVVEAVDALDPNHGALFVYGNYQGDRLNFGQAARQLEARDVSTATVIITDDVASAPIDRIATRRGVAGSIFAFRIAGAAAAAGYDLTSMARVTQDSVDRIRTVGVAFAGSQAPNASSAAFDIPTGSYALGMGVHGEPGLAIVADEPCAAIAERLVDLLLDDDRDATNTDTPILLVNLCGATTLMEGHILAADTVRSLAARSTSVRQVLVGNYLTTLDMRGASVSLWSPTTEMLELITQPSSCLAGLHLPGLTP